ASHPYITAPSYLTQLIAALRDSFPPQLSAATLKKLGIAPNNESSTISTLKRLGLLDAAGMRTPRAEALFGIADDSAFAAAFADLVRDAYRDLFEIRGENAWSLASDELATYFQAAGASPKVAGLQVKTFRILAEAAGRPAFAETGAARQLTLPRGRPADKSKAALPARSAAGEPSRRGSASRSANLTLHIDLHLPDNADQETYDRIFRSIREQLLRDDNT
ncbi:MAG: DUF5343 domain-containing protein, partial [Chloroflexi bacterium]|nr:DUF5343 domain-containing protein [Chloroflexota bacterium]